MSRYGPMNPEYKAKWLEALRSGKYEQTQGRLRDDDGMCCLGVLCNVVDPKKWERMDDYEIAFVYQDEEMFPPNSVKKKTGVTQAKCDKLSNMNDGGASFKQIADFIEKRF